MKPTEFSFEIEEKNILRKIENTIPMSLIFYELKTIQDLSNDEIDNCDVYVDKYYYEISIMGHKIWDKSYEKKPKIQQVLLDFFDDFKNEEEAYMILRCALQLGLTN